MARVGIGAEGVALVLSGVWFVAMLKTSEMPHCQGTLIKARFLVGMLKSKLGLMAAAFLCTGCSQAGSVVGTAPADLTMPEQIDVVFNHNATSRYHSPLTGDWRNGDDLERWLIEAIEAANDEVLVAVQELSLPGIAQALIAAQQRGLHVAVVLENNYSQAWSEQRPSRLNPRKRQRWHQLNSLLTAIRTEPRIRTKPSR